LTTYATERSALILQIQELNSDLLQEKSTQDLEKQKGDKDR
jgi:hypothetical protein